MDHALALLFQAEAEEAQGNLAAAGPMYEGGVQALLVANKHVTDEVSPLLWHMPLHLVSYPIACSLSCHQRRQVCPR